MNARIKNRGGGWTVLAATAAVLLGAGCEGPAQAQREVTILLMEYQGDNASAQAEVFRQQAAGLGIPNVFVVAGTGQASVCVGRFKSWNEKKAHDTLMYVQQIRGPDGQHPFASTMLTAMPEPMPENPWPLTEAKGYYTLQVATWEDPGRGPKAQAYAAELRAQGYEAYAHHGPRLSIVTVGAFGPKIFDHPELLAYVDPIRYKGPPMPKPKIIDPTVLGLMQKFPSLRLEGEMAPIEAHVTCPLIAIPGREAPNLIPSTPIPEALYRVTLKLVDTRTGEADAPLTATGVAPFKGEMQAVTIVIIRQILGHLPPGRKVRIGVAGILPMDDNAARQKVDATALDIAVQALDAAGGNVTVVGLEETQRLIAAAHRTLDDVLIDPRSVRDIKGVDYILTGTVTSFAPNYGGAVPSPGGR